jgi:hypothetical protein
MALAFLKFVNQPFWGVESYGRTTLHPKKYIGIRALFLIAKPDSQ